MKFITNARVLIKNDKKKIDHRYGKLIKKRAHFYYDIDTKKGFEVIHFLSEELQCIT